MARLSSEKMSEELGNRMVRVETKIEGLASDINEIKQSIKRLEVSLSESFKSTVENNELRVKELKKEFVSKDEFKSKTEVLEKFMYGTIGFAVCGILAIVIKEWLTK